MVMGFAIALGFVGIPGNENAAYVWLLELVVENVAMWGVLAHAMIVRR